MRYLGGKHKIGEQIAQYMMKQCPPDKVDGYLEPFCGSLGVFKHMTHHGYKKCIASDLQPDLIEMWKQLQNNTLKIPDKMNETEYNRLKDLPSDKPNAQRAMVGFFLSFGGKYFGGYAQKWEEKGGKDYLQTLKNGLEKMRPLIQSNTIENSSISFVNKSYLDWNPQRLLIYCDPPYRKTEKYTATEPFDHDLFWETMRKWSQHNTVFISEETCPPDFKSVWSHSKKRTLTSNLKNRKVKKEHLFVYSGRNTERKPNSKTKTKKGKEWITKNRKTQKHKTL